MTKEQEENKMQMTEQNDAFFTSVKQSLQQDAVQPPAQLDSFIKAAARQRAKKLQNRTKKYLLFWSSSIAAAFAVSFSAFYLTSLQTADHTNASPAAPQDLVSGNVSSTQQVANNNETGMSDFALLDVLIQIDTLSDELNDTDMEVTAISAWDQGYSMLSGIGK